MKISLPKLKAILLYCATFTKPELLGKVKLMKLFYFIDFTHLKIFGSPITYDSYVHLEHGPIPSSIKNLVDSVDDDIDNAVLSDTIKIERLISSDMHRVIPLRKFNENDAKLFSDTELQTLASVCKRFENKNARFIEDESHRESPWKKTGLLDNIPYELASEDPDCKTTKEEIILATEI